MNPENQRRRLAKIDTRKKADQSWRNLADEYLPKPEELLKYLKSKNLDTDLGEQLKLSKAEYQRQWRENNKERYSEYQRQWRENNRKKLNTYYREKYKERKNETSG